MLGSSQHESLEHLTTCSNCDIFWTPFDLGRAVMAAKNTKIEGEQISLSEIEQRLTQHPFVCEAAAIVLKTNGESIAAVITLNDSGLHTLWTEGKARLNQTLTESLAPHFEQTVLPKRFHYLETLPLNTQGKVTVSNLKTLFEPPTMPTILKTIKTNEQDSTQCLLSLHIPNTLIYFSGHFPQTPVLAGIIQIHWVIQWAKQLFGLPIEVFLKMDQAKFTHAICPDIFVELTLTLNACELLFKFHIEGKMFSSGRFKIS